MDLEVKTKQINFYNQINKALEQGFLSHAYIIESRNNDLEIVKKYLLFVIKKIYEDSYKYNDVTIDKKHLFHLLEKNEFPDYREIYPINNVIKKEQLLFIKDDFMNKSLYNLKKIYVVFDSERMNISASNTILKFLEEPSDDVVGIFVCNNQYNIIDTIRSRCQVISLKYENNDNREFSSFVVNFVDDIKNKEKNNLLIKFNYYLVNNFKDKNLAIIFVKDLLKYYQNELNNNLNNNDMTYILSIISILQEALNKLKYNVNMKLWLDNLLLSIQEV